jgi:hypothetical protein
MSTGTRDMVERPSKGIYTKEIRTRLDTDARGDQLWEAREKWRTLCIIS